MDEHYGPRTVRPEFNREAPSAIPPRPDEAQQEHGAEVPGPDQVEPSAPVPPPAQHNPEPCGC